jgi:broad specificity phosphatase PhoE
MVELTGQKWDPERHKSPPPSAETIESLVGRSLEWWNKHIACELEKSKTVLVVSHGELISEFLDVLADDYGYQMTFDLPDKDWWYGKRWQIRNASISTVTIDQEGRGTLISCGDISHLEISGE